MTLTDLCYYLLMHAWRHLSYTILEPEAVLRYSVHAYRVKEDKP